MKVRTRASETHSCPPILRKTRASPDYRLEDGSQVDFTSAMNPLWHRLAPNDIVSRFLLPRRLLLTSFREMLLDQRAAPPRDGLSGRQSLYCTTMGPARLLSNLISRPNHSQTNYIGKEASSIAREQNSAAVFAKSMGHGIVGKLLCVAASRDCHPTQALVVFAARDALFCFHNHSFPLP